MNITGSLAERYVQAVERYVQAVELEAERNRLYHALLTAQLAQDAAATAAAQLAVDAFEGEGAY